MANNELRESLKKANIKQWEMADHLGITEFTFSRKLRHPLPPDIERKCLEFIKSKQKGA